MRLLIVEDETDLLYALKKGLKQEGYAIDLAEDGETALTLLQMNEYDGLVLDINLPKMDGLTLLQKLREENQTVRVLILSANGEVDDRVAGLDYGANDYLVKPFHLKELRARLRALFRREFISMDDILEFGELKLDIKKRQIFWMEKEIRFTAKEFALLSYMMRRHDEFLSSETLMEHIWDGEADLFSNAVRVHIYAIRKKLLQATGFGAVIETQPMEGYRFLGNFYEVADTEKVDGMGGKHEKREK